MKLNKIISRTLAVVLFLTAGSLSTAAEHIKTTADKSTTAKIKMTFDSGEVVISLINNPTAADLLSLLPLTLSVSDFNNAEKIIMLPQTLAGAKSAVGYDSKVGDVALYAPWGNLAIFYRDASYAAGLLYLGRVESGLDALSKISNNAKIFIEQI
ncbi:MAG: hypothetical protein LBF13_02715 [Campylobacteraceae bacterium]|nr:hypothetical protein [Campylobacteraceae bacterium]